MNLVGNAMKFTENGSVRLRISCHGIESEAPLLRFAVADTGVGIAADQLPRLFGAFEQEDSSTTRKYGGSGLGLRISKRLAQMLGGDIQVSSEYGKGSVFTLTVATGPLHGVHLLSRPQPARDHEVAPRQTSGSGTALAGLRILFAEDTPANQLLVSYFLRKAGATVEIVANGRLALEKLTGDGTLDGALRVPAPFDLLVTDMQMPEMDGYTAARLLREKGFRLPIIALTAHAMEGDGDKCLLAGCDEYLAKPIDRERLTAVCSEAVSRQRRSAKPVRDEAAADEFDAPDEAVSSPSSTV
jgi:CheY-like chemotaxis protein